MKNLAALFTVLFVASVTYSVAVADPPPWAPAHGYYKKHKHKPKKHKGPQGVDIYAEIPPGGYIKGGRCRREAIGKAVGAVLGGVVGAKVGDAEPVAIIAGAIIGYVVGGSIGRAMDQRDRACVGQVLEYTDDHETVQWRNPDTNTQYQVTPTKTYESGGSYCREYTREATIAGKRQTVYGKACRQQDGAWRIVS